MNTAGELGKGGGEGNPQSWQMTRFVWEMEPVSLQEQRFVLIRFIPVFVSSTAKRSSLGTI